MHNKDSGVDEKKPKTKKKHTHKCLVWKDYANSRIEKGRPKREKISLNAAEIESKCNKSKIREKTQLMQ